MRVCTFLVALLLVRASAFPTIGQSNEEASLESKEEVQAVQEPKELEPQEPRPQVPQEAEEPQPQEPEEAEPQEPEAPQWPEPQEPKEPEAPQEPELQLPQEPEPEEPQKPEPQVPQEPEPQLPQEPEPQVPEKEGFCLRLPDGDYEVPEKLCSHEYISCTGGETIRRQCASDGLRFDAVSANCLEESHVSACGGQSTTTKRPDPIKGSDDPIPDVGVDCSSLDDGVYPSETESGCNRAFAACSDHKLTVEVCYGELVFDVDSLMCLSRTFVSACGGSPTTTAAPDADRNDDSQVDEFDCSGRSPGNYPDSSGCSNRYFSCSGGVSAMRKCADGLKFDKDSDKCLEDAFVDDCGGTPTTTTLAPLAEERVNEFDCTGLGDGNYALQQSSEEKGGVKVVVAACSTFFYSCVAGIASERTCEFPLVYDVATDRCLEEAYVAACGGTPTTTTKPSTGNILQKTLGVNCAMKEDGVYPDGRGLCSRMFVACVSHNAFEGQCASLTTRFDPISGLCLHPENVVDCDGVATTTAPLAPEETTTAAPDFDCSDLADGDYAFPLKEETGVKGSGTVCTRDYISCVAKRPIARSCPQTLRYDATTGLCLLIEHVEACGGVATTPHTVPPTEEDEGKTVPTTTARPNLEVECRKAGLLPDNRSGRECSRYFAACISGNGEAGITMECPASTRFDPEDEVCRSAAYITACGGTPLEKKSSKVSV